MQHTFIGSSAVDFPNKMTIFKNSPQAELLASYLHSQRRSQSESQL
jgi:hypothetical protein